MNHQSIFNCVCPLYLSDNQFQAELPCLDVPQQAKGLKRKEMMEVNSYCRRKERKEETGATRNHIVTNMMAPHNLDNSREFPFLFLQVDMLIRSAGMSRVLAAVLICFPIRLFFSSHEPIKETFILSTHYIISFTFRKINVHVNNSVKASILHQDKLIKIHNSGLNFSKTSQSQSKHMDWFKPKGNRLLVMFFTKQNRKFGSH